MRQRRGLEKELQSKLYQPWVASLCDLAELRPVRCISIGRVELRVVKEIEKLRAEIEVFRFRQPNRL
jgi:hypothetical protein